MALQILNDMHVSPEESLFLGDTATDMQTAVNAGVFPVGALWGFRSEEELVGARAKRLISNPMELLDILS